MGDLPLYVLECWNPRHSRYVPMWTGRSAEWALRMFQKPYYRRHTRRLIQITRTVVRAERGVRRG